MGGRNDGGGERDKGEEVRGDPREDEEEGTSGGGRRRGGGGGEEEEGAPPGRDIRHLQTVADNTEDT